VRESSIEIRALAVNKYKYLYFCRSMATPLYWPSQYFEMRA